MPAISINPDERLRMQDRIRRIGLTQANIETAIADLKAAKKVLLKEPREAARMIKDAANHCGQAAWIVRTYFIKP